MVFNSSTTIWVFLFLAGLWLAILTYLILKSVANYNRLTRGVSDQTLSQVLVEFLEQQKTSQNQMKRVLEEMAKLHKDSLHAIQKVGLVRFNPFADTGGDQSFCLALSDGNDNGIVITSLYSRSGVRWYVKSIRGGKGVEHELSKEEQAAVKKTAHLK